MIKSLLKYHFRGIYHFLIRKEFRLYIWYSLRYVSYPRHKHTVISFLGKKLYVSDLKAFLSNFYSIFVLKHYTFDSKTNSPVIIDCGANIGLSIIFFKSIFPNSRIIAFEADPTIYKILEKNILAYELKGITLINKAVWSEETIIPFISEGADAGRIDLQCKEQTAMVSTIRLSEFLKKGEIDLLKIDVEGAETEIIKECSNYLRNTRLAFVEFHSFSGRKQDLGNLLDIFSSNGFRYYIETVTIFQKPFKNIYVDSNTMDMLLNIYFIKPDIL
jgi:FkbM family methyltransferase